MKRAMAVIGWVIWHIGAAAQTVDSYIQKGNDYYRQSAYEMAERQYRKVLEKSPQNATALYNLANALYRQKKYDEAQEVLTRFTAGTVQNQNIKEAAYYNSGVIYSRQRDLPTSIEAYKNALRLNPNDKDARENLQKALSELRNQQQQNQRQQNQSPSMNQKQAEQKLKQLAEKERQLQERLQGRNARKGNSQEQDW